MDSKQYSGEVVPEQENTQQTQPRMMYGGWSRALEEEISHFTPAQHTELQRLFALMLADTTIPNTPHYFENPSWLVTIRHHNITQSALSFRIQRLENTYSMIVKEIQPAWQRYVICALCGASLGYWISEFVRAVFS